VSVPGTAASLLRCHHEMALGRPAAALARSGFDSQGANGKESIMKGPEVSLQHRQRALTMELTTVNT